MAAVSPSVDRATGLGVVRVSLDTSSGPVPPVGISGVARIAGTSLKVIHLVMDQTARGSTPEQVREQFPPLTLAQVYAALTYYHDHKAEFDAEIQSSLERVEQLRATTQESPIRKKLRAIGKLA